MDWSLSAWCGKDFERREFPAAAMQGLPRPSEAAGILAATGTEATTAAPTPLPSSVRSSTRPVAGPIPAPAQDPLPER